RLEFLVAEDGGLYFGYGELHLAVARTVSLFEKFGTHGGNELPVRRKGIDITVWDTASQMTVNILQILRFGAVNIARQVKVEVVPRITDFCHRYHARITWNLDLACKDVYDPVDVLGTQAIFRSIFHEASGGVDHEYAFAGVRTFFIQNHDAGRNSCSVKEIGGQANDALDVATLDE